MSNLYASIQGNRGQATRCGHKNIDGHIRGWHRGIKIIGTHNKDTHEDVFEVHITGGSNGDYLGIGTGLIFTLKGKDIIYEDKDIKLFKFIQEEKLNNIKEK